MSVDVKNGYKFTIIGGHKLHHNGYSTCSIIINTEVNCFKNNRLDIYDDLQ